MHDTKNVIREIVARNAIMQNRCWEGNDRHRLEYSCPGQVLLARGGLIQQYFGQDGRLTLAGQLQLQQALLDKFISADLCNRALQLWEQATFGTS